MSSAEVIASLARINLVLTLAALAVMALRLPLRTLFGARAAYVAWLIAPAAVIAGLAPRPMLTTPTISQSFNWIDAPVRAVGRVANPSFLDPALLIIWLCGAVVALAWLYLRQRRFNAAARRGQAGPAVAGFLSPRLVLPRDFEQRFDPAERAVVLAHEAIHKRRQDARINGLVAAVQCALWFNPVLHWAAYLMRIDQELSCDAVVTERHPLARGDYAQAMLKAQLAPAALPFGCHWPSGRPHPLTRRIALLKRPAPHPAQRRAGSAALAALISAAAVTGWALAPAVVAAPNPMLAVAMPAPGEIPRPGPEVALVNIQPDGIYIRAVKTSLPMLATDLRAYSAAKSAGDPVMVRADQNVPYAQVMPVLNALQSAGFAVNILAEDF